MFSRSEGTPRPCDVLCVPRFRALPNFTSLKSDPKVVSEEPKAGIEHIKLCVELWEVQRHGGRYLIIEQPAGASSWTLQRMIELLSNESTYNVRFDWCTC